MQQFTSLAVVPIRSHRECAVLIFCDEHADVRDVFGVAVSATAFDCMFDL